MMSYSVLKKGCTIIKKKKHTSIAALFKVQGIDF